MRIVIIDDDHLICDGLKLIFELEDDFEVVGVGHDGKEAFDLCSEQKPDLVLMDIRMPNVDGVSATSTIKKDFPQIKVILLTTFKDNEYIKAALNYGAEGYILKSQKADSIIKSVRAVGKGSVVFEKDVANMIPELISTKKYASPKDFQLTEREFDIVKLVGQGLSNKEISQKLYLSEGTVRNYLTLILEKLNLRDRTQLAIFFIHHFE